MVEEWEVVAQSVEQDPTIQSIDVCPSCGELLEDPPGVGCTFTIHLGVPNEVPRTID